MTAKYEDNSVKHNWQMQTLFPPGSPGTGIRLPAGGFRAWRGETPCRAAFQNASIASQNVMGKTRRTFQPFLIPLANRR